MFIEFKMQSHEQETDGFFLTKEKGQDFLNAFTIGSAASARERCIRKLPVCLRYSMLMFHIESAQVAL